MPWNVPQKYYDMHPLNKIELPPTRPNDLDDVPAPGVRMARSSGDHAKVLESGRWKEAIQAYLASISYLDGQVGRVLDALDRSAYRSNTIICFWGDHGWHLGEKEHWLSKAKTDRQRRWYSQASPCKFAFATAWFIPNGVKDMLAHSGLEAGKLKKLETTV